MKLTNIVFALAASTAPALAQASCGAAFCTVNSNWTMQSAATEAGALFDLRYEYIDQDHVRSDTAGSSRRDQQHREIATVNRNLVGTYSHTFNSTFGLSVSIPMIDREHTHVHDHDGQDIGQRWGFTKLGDMRVLGRYQLAGADPLAGGGNAGLLFGLKLPTGKTGVSNDEGEAAERALQPGSGTTDVLLGGYYQRALPQWGASWFLQGQFQQALKVHAGFKPGAQLGIDAGARIGIGDRLGMLVQLNGSLKRRDSGAQAEPGDSGGRFLSFSPGLAFAATDRLQIYCFVQLPVYRKVNGVQLSAGSAMVIGAGTRF